MTVRTHYFDTLENEPYTFDCSPACEAFKDDFSIGKGQTWGQCWVHYKDRVQHQGVNKTGEAALWALRSYVFDVYFCLRASIKIFSLKTSLNSKFKNIIFAIWNVTIADAALTLSIFTGIVVPSTRKLAEQLHKGNMRLNAEPKVDSPAVIEKKLEEKFL